MGDRRWPFVDLSHVLLLVLATGLWAQEPPPPADPLGLGERLALIEALRDTYGIRVEPGADLADLRARYAVAWQARQAPPAEDPAVERDAQARLRERIRFRFQREPPAELDAVGLTALYRQLTAAAAEKDAAHIARRLQEPDSAPVAPAPEPIAGSPAEPPSAGSPPQPAKTVGGLRVIEVPFAVEGVAGAAVIAGTKPALCVQFGGQRGREFDGVFAALYAKLSAGRGPRDAVFLLGHGNGVTINGAPIGPHLRANREFYETLGHTRPARRLECIVIASCARGSPVQMSAMRDGFGYYPTWRVATADRSYANALSVIAAFGAIADRPATTAWRGIFRMGREPEVVGSLGEVGEDGAKGGMLYFDLGVDGNVLTVTER